jgi:hypothetical protein
MFDERCKEGEPMEGAEGMTREYIVAIARVGTS